MAARSIGGGVVWSCVLILLVALPAGCERKPAESVHKDGPVVSEYTGSEACKECHEEIYNGWKATFHAYKFQPANPDFVVGDFDRNNTLKTEHGESRMFREGNAFVVTTTGPDGQPHDYPVRYAVGSIWKQRYVTEFPNGALHVLPVQWNLRSQEWVDYHGTESNKPGDGGFWSDPGRRFQEQCMGCHTTNASCQCDETQNVFTTRWTDLGVGCEACHGAGKEHIEAPILNKAETIINPAKMADPRRASMICASCHTRGSTPDGKFAYAVGYRPGGQLNFLFDKKPAAYPDGSPKDHHQQFNDWEASDHASAGVMCWDCHSPHAKGKANRFQLKLPGSLLCATCHTIIPRGVHGLHSVNNCIGCHMPSTAQSATPGDLRSHRMAVVRPELTVEAGDAEKQPNSCNLCHYHRDYGPERLVHFLRAVQKPQTCKTSNCHVEDDLDEPMDVK